MKFAHIFNYSYLIGFAIFKCGAEIYEITDRGLEPTELEETSHFRLMKRFILDRRGILRQMELEKE